MTEEKGKQILTAVERILASSESIKATVEDARVKAKEKVALDKELNLREQTARELVRHYSNRAAITGGVTGLPALIPGVGSIAAMVGGGLAEFTLLLKWEVEMSLALSHVFGFDIDDPRERQLGFLMASVGTYDATGKNFFVDVARVEGTAIWNYAPRAIGRLVVEAIVAVAAIYLWRGLFKALPVIGIAIGTGMNKVLTQRVGARVARDLQTRRALMRDDKPAATKTKAPARPKTKAKPKAARRRPVAVVPPADDLN
jgi:hypothetical protein